MSSSRKLVKRRNIVVGIGEYRISCEAHSELITYSLGSCVGLTVYDPTAKVGGMLHALLPCSKVSQEEADRFSHKFVDSGMVGLFHAVYAMGGKKNRLEVRLAGGGDFLDEKKIFRIGEKNVAAVHEMLQRNEVRLLGEHTGGRLSRTMRLDLDTGNVTVEIPGHGLIKL